MKTLNAHIKNKTFSNIYLIFGTEEYLKNLYEKKLISSIVDENLKMMNFDIFEGKNISLSNVIDACDTLPFMCENRVVVLKNTGLCLDNKEDSQKLESYLPSLPKTTILIFIEEKIDKRQKLFKTISSLGYICELNNLLETDLIKWLVDYFNKNEKLISEKTALYLIRNTSTNMEQLINEANKLISYKSSKEISIKDIDAICTKSVESKIFTLIDFIGNRQLEKAIDMYNNLINNKTSPFLILNMIQRQLKIILQVKYLKDKGSISYIASELSLKDFVVKQALNQSKNFKNKTLLKAINECLEIDNNIKTGKVQDVLAVELFIIKYTTCQNINNHLQY